MSEEEKVEETLKEIEESTELSEAELDNVAGGFCIVFGVHEPDAECGEQDFYACAYLGVTFGGD